jgi:hypothetical protein
VVSNSGIDSKVAKDITVWVLQWTRVIISFQNNHLMELLGSGYSSIVAVGEVRKQFLRMAALS